MPLIIDVLATKTAVTRVLLATKAAVITPVLATILPACNLDVNDSVVVTYEFEFNDITYALLDVYNVAVLTNVLALKKLTLIAPVTLAEPAFSCVLAVIIPPSNEVLAMIVPILAEPASIPLITLAAPTFN